MRRLVSQLQTFLPLKGVLVAATDTLMTFPPKSLEEMMKQARIPVVTTNKRMKAATTTTTTITPFTDDCVTGFGILTHWDFGTRHGVYFENENGEFSVLQKATKEVLFNTKNVLQNSTVDAPAPQVILDSGIVHLGTNVVRAFMQLTNDKSGIFFSLTNEGLDSSISNGPPVRFELYTDVMGALQGVVDKSLFLSSSASAEEGMVRQALVGALGKFPLKVCVADGKSRFIHVGTTVEHRDLALSCLHPSTAINDAAQLGLVSRWKSFEGIDVDDSDAKTSKDSVLINSYVGGGCVGVIERDVVVEHCHIRGHFRIESGAMVSGFHHLANAMVKKDIVCQELPIDVNLLRARFPDNVVLERVLQQTASAASGTLCYCITVFGIRDGIKESFESNTGTFCHQAWPQTKFPLIDVWPLPGQIRNLWTARMFPIAFSAIADDTTSEVITWLQNPLCPVRDNNAMTRKWRDSFRISLSDLVWITDVDALFHWRSTVLPAKIRSVGIVNAIEHRQEYPFMLPEFKCNSSKDLVKTTILNALDDACGSFLDESLCARLLSCMGDLLAGKREPRSGNSNHPEFSPLLLRLRLSRAGTVERRLVLGKLAALRDSEYWSGTLDAMTRCARHYDAASQILTGRCLFDAGTETVYSRPVTKHDGKWTHATAPARIDLSGGWSDTPPITNEDSGAVCNVAVMLQNNQHPIGASARILPGDQHTAKVFVLRTGRASTAPPEVECRTAEDFDDHLNPKAKAALAKCVLLSVVGSTMNLFQLDCGGLELCVYSDLPPGSGLGGSSIVAACAVACVCRALGWPCTKDDIVKYVLKVEQLLSTGGGWQDQIGAVFPGFKIGTSAAMLPIRVNVKNLPVPKATVDLFEKRGMLVQTGPARLARDLLQNVIRRWHRREPEFRGAIQLLRLNSARMETALMEGRIDDVAGELNEFWRLKKLVAGEQQAQPPLIARLLEMCHSFSIGMSLCGAGGGGFAVLLLKETESFQSATQRIKKEFPEMLTFPVFVCNEGLKVLGEE